MLMNYKGIRDGNNYLINLIDSPGHVDFSSEVTAALRITDGALVVVDCLEGVCVQTETVLRQALEERVRPVLTVNKLDRCFGLIDDGEEAYDKLRRVIESTNVIMATYSDTSLGEVQSLYPEKGNVSFSAGIYGWAFTLTTFANVYSRIARENKKDVEPNTMLKLLWNDNFLDTTTNIWSKKLNGKDSCKRGFVYLIYDQIQKVREAAIENRKDELSKLIKKFG